ncbi:MAG: putative 2-aminoethylphosphonate ABC transporter permease subunit [Candidatus Rokubacteria bacterium]|nr:putative 2-aminoethylphosphonate ABC transporter permease subunit [Candidatus Rokubacteria bacterium]MBI3104696.1 putative 2-aminoethylphosphonate ABC transporter permease subunit [Candidatus Rokubacteria bacterium]
MAVTPADLAAAIPDRTVRHRLGREDVVRYALVAAFAAVLYLFIVLPMAKMLWRSLLDNAGHWVGLANYVRYFGTPAIAASVTNSLSVSAAAMVLTVALAFVYAYALTRTWMPAKGLFRVVAMLPIFAPSLVQSIAFVYAFGNNGIFTRLTDINVGIYGAKGIIFAEVFYCFPHALLILVAALSATDARLYDAAKTLGASAFKTFRTVTLPGVKYGLVGACFVVFTTVITDFGIPKVIGGKFSVMATEIYNQVSGQQNFTMGATVSVVLLVPALVAFFVDRLIQRRSYSLVTASSRPLQPVPNRWLDWGLLAYCAVIAGVIAGIYLVILVSSLVHRWPYNFGLTLKHYAFDTVGGYRPLLNSVYVSALSAVAGTVATFVGAYVVEKCRTVASGPLYLLSMLPVSIPGMVLGLAYIFTFNAPDSVLNRLYGTLAILVISNVIHFFTVGFLTATTSLKQMDAEFENVSASLGVPFYRTFWRVTVPIALPSIVAVSMYFFLNAMVTLSALVFLVAPGTEMAAVAVLLMDDAGDTAQAAAMSVLIIAIGLCVRFLYWLAMRGVTGRTQAWAQAPAERAETPGKALA